MINGKKSLFYTVLMAGALMSCGGPKQAPSEEVAKSGNPVFEGWYADPEGIIYGDTYWIYPTTSDLYEKQTFFDCFSSKDLVNWTKHTAILDTAEVKWAKIAMWAPSVINKDGKYYLFFGANDVHEGEIGSMDASSPEVRNCTKHSSSTSLTRSFSHFSAILIRNSFSTACPAGFDGEHKNKKSSSDVIFSVRSVPNRKLFSFFTS